MSKTIYIGADHAGYEYKEQLKNFLSKQGYEIIDKGNFIFDKDDDYVDFAHAVSKEIKNYPEAKGILLCGNAQGVCIVANKLKGIRAITGFDDIEVKTSRTDDDSNILCLPARIFPLEKIQTFVTIWLETDFSQAERHLRRLNKLKDIEEKLL
ncbi:ribose-5-phosphate isomerase [Candidatus Uhrbacteria bacterium CG_4_9_14_3_um_filter_36_7]|uniref:Ribose-5-phosphate isomerase n=1 Tax=Candidatus Uhrbacteria bacterium CG_4_9_14_3_um_filter_36_7 TaxID=1975033 RepID=A0A2M7XH48_9BACT|nr:MAG: ribose-5-phosphate isomerase [Candidatus Uhrbacteria bacterium CG_4_9_14_3_um_filter_36_7]